MGRTVVLEGDFVRLEPLTLAHAPELAEHTPAETFRLFVTGRMRQDGVEALTEFLECTLLPMANTLTFAIIDRASGKAVGSSSYLEIREPHRSLEIGITWIGERFRGTYVNPEAKLLMLKHAFETLGAIRVQLKTDARNLQSQAAIKKLGATYEGTLRNFGIMPDGYYRDTVMFSILPAEWPDVEAGLRERLAAFAAQPA